jgi:hypothetical protein
LSRKDELKRREGDDERRQIGDEQRTPERTTSILSAIGAGRGRGRNLVVRPCTTVARQAGSSTG